MFRCLRRVYPLKAQPTLPMRGSACLQQAMQTRSKLFIAQRLSLVVLFRGENGPGGWAMREAEDNPNRTEYVWLFDVDLKVTKRFF